MVVSRAKRDGEKGTDTISFEAVSVNAKLMSMAKPDAQFSN